MAPPRAARRRLLRALLAAAMLVACWLPVGSALAAESEIPTVPARSADALVDSIGVNTHLYYTDTAYRDYPQVKARLLELGVRHIRDGLATGREDLYARLNDLAASGIKANLIMGDPANRYGTGTLDQLVPLLRDRVRGAVESAEGANEYDISGDPNWPSVVRAHQQRLYSLVKQEPALASLPVLGPSFVRWESYDEVGDLSSTLDFGNLHPYPGGNAPSRNHLNAELGRAAKVSASKPVMATETGYHNAVASTGGHRPASERAAAIYIPRLYLEHFRMGFSRTFLYELLDQRPDAMRSDAEANFGLLRHDFSRKPAFAALRNLIALLRDEGGGGAAGSLRYRLEGDAAGIEQLLFAKRDGSLYLALWQNASAFDTQQRLDLYPPEREVTLTFDGARRAEIYRPGDSAASLAAYASVKQLRLSVPADVVVVKVSGKARRGGRATGSVATAQAMPAVAPALTSDRQAVKAKLSADAAAAARLLKRMGRRKLTARGGFRTRVRPLRGGSYEIGLVRARRASSSSTRSRVERRRSLLALGRRAFVDARSGRISVPLTPNGRSILARAKRLRLALRFRFVDAHGRRSSVTRKVMLGPDRRS